MVMACCQVIAGGLSTSANTYNGAHYIPGVIVLKMKPAYKSFCTTGGIAEKKVTAVLQRYNQPEVSKKFLHSPATAQRISKRNAKTVDLGLIYQLNFPVTVKIGKLINELVATGVVEYAEPLYLNYFDYTPNDPQITSQYHLAKVNAYNGWDIWKGDTNTVIGIVDSGTDWDHPDLAGNIKYNYADPIDGIDNDNDGYIDNFRGWDVSENDNSPMVVSSTHGSHVSGCAAAVTDNATGVAAPGFLCKFLPVKASLDASTSAINNGYDGIVYAVDHGANVINCSWGRTGGVSQFEQDIINYAALDYDVLMVCAAGNDGLETDHYPSSYANVTSVAATGQTDSKANYSNYGYNIDVCAPGTNVYATVFNNSYTAMTGTSMASPVAAGCAAVVRSRFPSMNALQAAMQLRVTCDNIYGATGNSALLGKLGKGRVNLYRALTDSVSSGLLVQSLKQTDGNDNVFVAGDTLNITAILENLLRPTTNLVCTLSSTSTYVSVLQNTFTHGVINTLDTASNFPQPYLVRILPTAPTNQDVVFKLRMTDGIYTDDYYFMVTVNVDYLNIQINDVGSSITSRSLIGFNTTGQTQGIGFTYKGSPTILYEMGLMIGASGTQVSDNVRGDGTTYDSDWSPFINIVGTQPGVVSDFDAVSTFKDNGGTSSLPMNLIVRQNAYAWIQAPDNKYIMMQYYIKNNSTTTYTDLFAGIFADWDIPAYANNKASIDLSRRLGYIWSTDSAGIWAGIQVLSNTAGFQSQAIDNLTGGAGGLDISAGFINAQKYTALSTSRNDAGLGTSTGNDCIHVVSTGGINLAPGDSVEVAFALIAGENLQMLQESADAAQIRYNNLPTGLLQLIQSGPTGLKSIYPNPAQSGITVSFTVSANSSTVISVFSLKGELVQTLVNESLLSGTYSLTSDISALASGNYLIRMTSGNYQKSLPLHIVR